MLQVLSDNVLEQAQSNTVSPAQEEMDRVGFEPTTSAAWLLSQPPSRGAAAMR
jgi:hypothetical protein